MQGCRWCFTINNPNDEEIEHIKNGTSIPDVRLIIAELEHTNGEGTKHIQGYIEFQKRLRANQVKFLISKRAHIEIAQGSREQNITYCTKENNILINYQQEQQKHSQQNFWQELLTYIQSSPTPAEFAEAYPKFYLTSPRIDRLLAEQAGRNAEAYNGELQDKNYWIWGPPGVGKSRWANMQAPNQCILHKAINKWWDGYRHQDHKVILIEDWPAADTHMEQYLKWWGDRFPFTAEIKGGSLVIEPRAWNLIITSNHSIETAFKHCLPDDITALKRRFTEWQIEDNTDIRLTTFIHL